MEALQLETWERLEKAVTVNSGIATHFVSLRDRTHQTPEAPATEVLDSDEMEVLVTHFRGKMQPAELTIRQAVL